ncbi:MAG: short chain dehydrogenase [Hydrocarboniphaga sp.]|uniref:SDR family oxidoreductase n=1 Tax=Hydrocarboniphaga sp. TaxID=2033016 RepID=UPI002637F815|nr:SDR family oxidoreductase [Hydrocarboniphaga sp.]MDB5968668.1 short chain dehydrogenase [Hydrocarboniphaga sp.]
MSFSIDQFQLAGKVAIVTGAGGRGNSIGRAYAFGLANAGASVVVADINGEGAKLVADEIAAAGGKAISAQVDITKPESAAAMVKTAVDAFGGVDILVNNAALMAELGSLQAATISLDDWNRIFNVNLTGALICSQAVVPEMRKRGGGKIINQTSGGAFPAASVYGISKLALVGLTTTLARQLGREKINVNAIAPGNVTSDAGRALTPDDSPFIKFLEMSVAMRVRGAPDELVGSLLLLCSAAGDWITGQVLHVDGGWVLRP